VSFCCKKLGRIAEERLGRAEDFLKGRVEKTAAKELAALSGFDDDLGADDNAEKPPDANVGGRKGILATTYRYANLSRIPGEESGAAAQPVSHRAIYRPGPTDPIEIDRTDKEARSSAQRRAKKAAEGLRRRRGYVTLPSAVSRAISCTPIASAHALLRFVQHQCSLPYSPTTKKRLLPWDTLHP
jgi:hypothetical protein